MIDFVKDHIIYQFGIPQTSTTDQGTMFTSGEFDEFAVGMGIKVLNSSPQYAQANRHLTKELLNLSNGRLRKILGGGIHC